MNKVFILGRLTADIVLKETEKKQKYIRFILAVKRRGKDAGTDFISVKAWNKSAEFIHKYFQKGSPILIAGHMATDNYDDKDGKRVYTTDVVVEEVYFVGFKNQEKAEDPQVDEDVF